jgi:PAS domain S-box-containing protein
MNVPALMATYQLRQREYLLRITRAMTSRLDLPSLLKLILSGAAEMVGCKAGLIVLAPENLTFGQAAVVTDKFEIRATYNIARPLLPAFQPLLDMDLLPQVEEGGDHLDEGSSVEPGYQSLQEKVREVEKELGFALGKVVGLPLMFEDELLGVIYLFRSEYAFTQVDWQILQGFAHQAAIAVRNARLYHQLETERSRLATIIENSVNGIMILDAQRRVLIVNQSLAAMVGRIADEIAGLHCHDVLALDNVLGDDLCQNEEDNPFVAQGSLRCEGDLNRPGGSRLTVSVTFTPLYDERGEVVNIIANIHDITRFREEEEMKSTFTSIISHELKTPVALIKGYAQTLAREDADWDLDTAREGLQIIEEEADRLEGLINDLLDVSRIQASGLSLDFADVNLQDLAGNVARVFRTQTDNHQIELDFDQTPPLIWGDEERLRQVLTNLVGSAIKYSPDGGLIRIGGWTEESSDDTNEPSRVVIYVADQGIGIPQYELRHIFDQFYRVDSSLRRGTAGTGLGLFLARAIVEAHDGLIWVRSEPGQGTTFFVGLPVEETSS